MAPMAPSLPRSEPKTKFLARIGLDESNRLHRHLYAKMKSEAVQGWRRVTQTPDALCAAARHDSAVAPPYTFGQIDERAIRAEVTRIFERASPMTRIMYKLALDDESPVGENWIIRWLLWHVFRYRDDRNGGVARKSAVGELTTLRPLDVRTAEASCAVTPVPYTGSPSSAEARLRTHSPCAVTGEPDTHSPCSEAVAPCTHFSHSVAAQPCEHCSRASRTTAESSRSNGGVALARYWDPVRDKYRER